MMRRLRLFILLVLIIAMPLTIATATTPQSISKSAINFTKVTTNITSQKIKVQQTIEQTSYASPQSVENINTNLPFIFNRYRDVSVTVTWYDGRVTTLKWHVVANIYVKYIQTSTTSGIVSWYIPALELRKDYYYEEGNWWSGYHIDDTSIGSGFSWYPDMGYDSLAFDQMSIHYIPKAGTYVEQSLSNWAITISFTKVLTVSVTWTPSSSGKEEVQVETSADSFHATYIDKHDNGVHAAYPYNGRYADWAVALMCRTDKLEKGSILISRPVVAVKYHKWDLGGLVDHYETKFFWLPVDANNIIYHYDNYYDGYKAINHIADVGVWR